MIFAEKLILLRRKKGWSQEELAEKMDVTRQSVSKWESAQSMPDIEKLIRLSELFGVSTDYLLKEKAEDIFADDPEESPEGTGESAPEHYEKHWENIHDEVYGSPEERRPEINRGRGRAMAVFKAVYWPLVTVVYILYSFLTGNWNISWIIWLVASIIYSAVKAVDINMGYHGRDDENI